MIVSQSEIAKLGIREEIQFPDGKIAITPRVIVDLCKECYQSEYEEYSRPEGGTGETYILHSYRFGALVEHECGSMQEALDLAQSFEEEISASPSHITLNGYKVYDCGTGIYTSYP